MSHSSISRTFTTGPLRRWNLTVGYTVQAEGRPAYARIQLEDRPGDVWAALMVAPGVDGYSLVTALLARPSDAAYAQLAEWLVGEIREALTGRTDLPERTAVLWARLVDNHDTAHADYAAMAAGVGVTPAELDLRLSHPFRVARVLYADRATGRLIGA